MSLKPAGTWRVLVCSLLVLACAPCFFAKQKPPITKTVSGSVLDSSGRGVAGASVLLTDAETHRTVAIYSGTDGSYEFSGLSLTDDYRIQAKYQGAASDVHGVSSFDGRVNIVVNLVLNPPSKTSPSGT